MAEQENLRYKNIDEDTRVGFNYIKQKYYVTNKGYSTYRPSIATLREVLEAMDITGAQISDAELENFKSELEDLTAIYYTLQDNGAYVHTLQFNDFSNYPLTLDCEKGKLYIMNSTIIYDLTLNESARNVRVPRLRAFYKDTLGLLISQKDMLALYNYLLSFYNPICYNQVGMDEETNTLYYTNKIILSDFDKTSPVTYICTDNPNNNAPITPLGSVIATNSNTNVILTSSIIPNLQEGDKVIVSGTEIEISGNMYSADGTYTIQSVNSNALTVEETIPTTYVFPYDTCYIESANYNILSMNRETRTITIAENPTALLIGDTINVIGANTETAHETISCDGSYTIENIKSKEENETTIYEIIVEDDIPTDFEGTGANLTKEVYIGSIAEISNQIITFTGNIPASINNLDNSTVILYHEEESIGKYTVSSSTENTVTITEAIEDYTPVYPTLESPLPDRTQNIEILIEVTRVKEPLQEIFPIGEFLLDNFTQCQNYIKAGLGYLYEKYLVPSEENKNKMYVRVETERTLPQQLEDSKISTIYFKGLYSKIYSE